MANATDLDDETKAWFDFDGEELAAQLDVPTEKHLDETNLLPLRGYADERA